MKKIFLLIALLSCFLFASCQKSTTSNPTATPAPSASPTQTASASDKYKKIMESKTRPIAFMIDNDDKNARPHSGIDQAYLLYEIPVEGGATRIMALFKDVATEKIGPVRSSRHYFLDYALENDAIYVHYGWSPQAQSDISSLKINNINGVASGYSNFWRQEKYKGDWHSAFTNIQKTLATATKMGYRTETNSAFPYKMSRQDTELAQGQPITKINIPYAGFYKVAYTYDETKKVYNRYINNSLHKTSDGVTLTAKNIILQNANVYAFGDGTDRRQVDTVSKGTGTFITDGKSIPITWKKDSRSGKTVYTLENGNELNLNPGTTYIHLIASSTKIVTE